MSGSFKTDFGQNKAFSGVTIGKGGLGGLHICYMDAQERFGGLWLRYLLERV